MVNSKHNINDVIFYINNNKVHSAPILSIRIIQINPEISVSNSIQSEMFRPFGAESITYATTHGLFEESSVFKDRESLIKSI